MRGAGGMSPFEERPSLALDRLADRADYAMVGPMDGRTRVLRTSRPPYAAMCQLERDFGTAGYVGLLRISDFPNVVVTAAHCVLQPPPGICCWAAARRDVSASPRPQRRRCRRRSDTSRRSTGMRRGVSSSASDVMYDFGLVETPGRSAPALGVFPLSPPDDARLQDRSARAGFCISPGYPCDKPRGHMWEHAERPRPRRAARPLLQRRHLPGTFRKPGRGFGAIVPAMSAQSASMSPGRRDTTRTNVTGTGTFAPPGATNRGVRVTRELIAMGRTSMPERRILISRNCGEGRGERSCSQLESSHESVRRAALAGARSVRRSRRLCHRRPDRRAHARAADVAAALCRRVPDRARLRRRPAVRLLRISGAPNVVVTAAHCVFSRPRHLLLGRGAPRRIRVTPARNGTGPPPFGYQWAVRWYAHRRFVERGDVMYDFGLVVTPRPFRALPSVFPLSAPDDARLEDIRAHRLLHIAGYPGDKPAGTMWEHAERSTASGSARSITASTPVPDIPAARCGFSGIVPAMSMPSPSMWPGRCRTNAAPGAAGRACRSRRRAPSIAASA